MTANAPYYQMPSGQFITAPSSTNATPSHFVSEADEYDLATAAVASPHEHNSASFSENTVCHTPVDTSMTTTEENRNLAELLEAATTAAGQAAQAMDAHDAVITSTAVRDKGRKKRASCSSTDDVVQTLQTSTVIAAKRRRVDVPTDPQLRNTEYDSRDSPKSTTVPPCSESLLTDARTAGVHSAAALFRRPSEKTSRKYTRPPMSKLFMSLRLSPENFLQLQAQAKAYMLDTTYPERQKCVGNRGKGDTDMVKLRLFNCVRDFLDDGVGEHFFGENVEKPGEQDAIEAARALGEDKVPTIKERLMWPRDGNEIIGLVTPLMRRMVTNERQRMYAIETRKGGAKRKDEEDSVEDVAQQIGQSSPDHSAHGENAEQVLQPAFDPTLCQVSHTSQSASPLVGTPSTQRQALVAHLTHSSRIVQDDSLDATDVQLPTEGSTEPRLSNINIFLTLAAHSGIKLDQKRILEEPPNHLTNYQWDDFLREITRLLKRAKAKYPSIREHVKAQNTCSTSLLATINTINNSSNLTDNLRELAAAANAMQSDNNIINGEGSAKKNIDMVTTNEGGTLGDGGAIAADSLADPETTLLPRHVIKTVGPNGWEVIEDAEQWSNLLMRRGLEVWADGVVNMIVELVDIPSRMERRKEG
jgi:hypothetical protein